MSFARMALATLMSFTAASALHAEEITKLRIATEALTLLSTTPVQMVF